MASLKSIPPSRCPPSRSEDPQAAAGFLGIESVRDADGTDITVWYQTVLESIREWKGNAEHLVAQQRGMREWYSRYVTRVSRVEYDYELTDWRRWSRNSR